MIKTCGECKHCENKKTIATCQYVGIVSCDDNWCRKYERKALTNGDKIRQMGNRELAELDKCDICIYFDGVLCLKPDDKTCVDGIEPYLNAPAESEVKDE
jgi:hypothetical protein